MRHSVTATASIPVTSAAVVTTASASIIAVFRLELGRLRKGRWLLEQLRWGIFARQLHANLGFDPGKQE
jgi:hypothetical protein